MPFGSRQIRTLTHPLVGIGVAFAANAAPLLITELSYPTQVRQSFIPVQHATLFGTINLVIMKQRGQLTSIYNSSWYIGSILGERHCLTNHDWGPSC